MEITREFNIRFQSIPSLGLFKWPDSFELSIEPESIKGIVNKYKNRPSTKEIKSKYITINPLSF